MSIQERIQAFEFIKNIPYKIALTPEAPDYCCSSKSMMLEKLLKGLGLQTRQIICTFDWDEMLLPPEILRLPRDDDETHQFLQVFIPETQSWVSVDPTWDSELEKLGLPIATWDGLSHTVLAVKAHHM